MTYEQQIRQGVIANIAFSHILLSIICSQSEFPNHCRIENLPDLSSFVTYYYMVVEVANCRMKHDENPMIHRCHGSPSYCHTIPHLPISVYLFIIHFCDSQKRLDNKSIERQDERLARSWPHSPGVAAKIRRIHKAPSFIIGLLVSSGGSALRKHTHLSNFWNKKRYLKTMPSSTPRTAPSSPFFKPSTPSVVVVQQTPGGTRRQVRQKEQVEEKKSGLLGCTANLVNAIVGSGIVGIPFAIKEAGFVAGILLVIFCGILTDKSLRLLIATAKQ